MNQNNFSLENKNIIISGASSGIGRQCAIECSKMGANVISIGRNEDRLKETLAQLSGVNHISFNQDITDYNSLEPLISESVSKLGKISGFIHCAGVEKTIPLSMMNAKIYNDIFSINVIAGFELARLISKKKYIDPAKASFVFISSILAKFGKPGIIGYSSSKGALLAGAKAMACELYHNNITVNCVLPGVVKTPMTESMLRDLPEESARLITNMYPMGLGEPADVANACVYLLSDASKWVTGTELVIDGGYSMF